MKSRPRFAACALAGCLASAPVWAQPAASSLVAPTSVSATLPSLSPGAASTTVSLRSALDAAWQRAVTARETEGERRRADAERIAAGGMFASPPALELGMRTDRLQSNAGSRELEIGVALPLWLPGQRAARAGSAEASAAQALASEAAARLRLAGEVREAAWQWAALQAEVGQIDSQVGALRQLADDVERRVRMGDLARADSLAARAEALSASADLADARQRLRAAQVRWTLLTGLTAMPELSEASAQKSVEGDLGQHPELHLATLSTEVARKRVDVMRYSRRDAPELTLGIRQDMPGRGEASQGSLAISFRLPFGSDERNRPLEAAALSELDIAQTQEQRMRERLDSDIATAREAHRSVQTQLDAETARAQLLQERANLIDMSFRAGETPLPELLRAHAAAAQAKSAVARQTVALGMARARLQQALGLLP